MKDQLEWLLTQISLRKDEDPEIRAAALEELKDLYAPVDKEQFINIWSDEWIKQKEESSPTIREILKGEYLTTQSYDRVKEFMQKIPQDTPEEICIPAMEIRQLRAKLIFEEAIETIDALGVEVGMLEGDTWYPYILDDDTIFRNNDKQTNLIGIIDGCNDIQVVTLGTLISCGVPDVPFQREVDESNLRKFEPPKCPKCNIEMYIITFNVDGQEDAWYCPTWDCAGKGKGNTKLSKEAGPYRREDGKWIKPPYWTPPNHQKILEEFGYEKEPTSS